MDVRVQREDFVASEEALALTRSRADIGAVVTFVGLCRDEGGTLAALEIEHYPGMAEAEIADVVTQAQARWPLLGVRAIRLMTNNPAKVAALEAVAVKVIERVPHRQGANPHNARYLDTKRDRSGHLL